MFAGLPPRTRTRASRSTSTTSRLPELAPDEALVAVMASSINFNTVWTSIFEPLPDVRVPASASGKESVWGARHDQPFHVVGSDAAGVVLRVGSAVRLWKPGDAVTVHCNHVDDQDPSAHDDSMLATNQRIWGYETNYGGLGELTRGEGEPADAEARAPHVGGGRGQRAHQLHELPHAREPERRADDAGPDRPDLGCERRHRRVRVPVRAQRRRHAGRGRVEPRARRRCVHEMGVEHVIDRKAEGFQFWKDEHTQDPAEWRRFGKRIRELVGTDPDIVFEHPGRSTMGASVFVCARGGMIITCAATTGFMIEYDNRYLWMNQKTLKGCHFANYREAWEANRLIVRGQDPPGALGGVPVRGDRRGGRCRCTTTCTRASSACSCSRPRRVSA